MTPRHEGGAAMATLRNPERPLYVLAAWFVAIVVFAGFARTFYLRFLFDTPDLPLLWRIHGALMTSWIALFVAQATLVAAKRTDLHRRLGIGGAVLAAIIVAVNASLGIAAARAGHAPAPGIPPLAFLAVPLFDAAVFAVLFGSALWFRRRSDVHKRLMLLAGLNILTPAVARLPLPFYRSGTIVTYFLTTIAVVAICLAWDTLRNRRLHPAFAWGAVLIAVSWPLRLALAGTPLWIRFATWLTQ